MSVCGQTSAFIPHLTDLAVSLNPKNDASMRLRQEVLLRSNFPHHCPDPDDEPQAQSLFPAAAGHSQNILFREVTLMVRISV